MILAKRPRRYDEIALVLSFQYGRSAVYAWAPQFRESRRRFQINDYYDEMSMKSRDFIDTIKKKKVKIKKFIKNSKKKVKKK